MDFNKLFDALREQGVVEVSLSFKLGEKRVSLEIPPEKEQEQQVSVQLEKDNVPESKINKLELWGNELRKTHQNYYSIAELTKMCELSHTRMWNIVKEADCPSIKFHRTNYYDIETLWLKRSDHEHDVLVNDGHRRGGTKFVCSSLYKHIKPVTAK